MIGCSHDEKNLTSVHQTVAVWCSLFARLDCSLSPLSPQGPSSPSCGPFSPSSPPFIFLPDTAALAATLVSASLRLSNQSPRSAASSYFLFSVIFPLLSLKKMAISHFQLVHKHHKKPRSAEVVKRTASACTSFLFYLQGSYLTTTTATQHAARVVSTLLQRWVTP